MALFCAAVTPPLLALLALGAGTQCYVCEPFQQNRWSSLDVLAESLWPLAQRGETFKALSPSLLVAQCGPDGSHQSNCVHGTKKTKQKESSKLSSANTGPTRHWAVIFARWTATFCKRATTRFLDIRVRNPEPAGTTRRPAPGRCGRSGQRCRTTAMPGCRLWPGSGWRCP
ncbi:unnamed protein product [Ixodes hexagonus]